MKRNKLNRRETFILQWSPILLVPALVWLILSLQRGPISIPYLASWLVIGILYAASLILHYGKKPSPLWPLFPSIILFGGLFATEIIFRYKGSVPWRTSQGLSIVLVSIFAFAWAFRGKLMASS